MRLSHRRKRDHKYKVRRHAWKSKQARVEVKPAVQIHYHIDPPCFNNLSDEAIAEIDAKIRAVFARARYVHVFLEDLIDDDMPVEPPRSLWARLKDKFSWLKRGNCNDCKSNNGTAPGNTAAGAGVGCPD